jgi:hypothetical protein
MLNIWIEIGGRVVALVPVAAPVGDRGIQYSSGRISLAANHGVSRFFNKFGANPVIILQDWRD